MSGYDNDDPVSYASANDYILERNKALTDLDMRWARRMAVQGGKKGYLGGMTDEELLAGMHKARYHIPGIARELRLESAAFLRERGLGDLFGVALLPEGQLPD